MEGVYTVTAINRAIKEQLEGKFPSVCVEGEVSNYTRHSSGHLYFSLKDRESQIQAVMFRGSTQALSRFPREGDQLLVRGSVRVYSVRGAYQILVHSIEYRGIGDLLLQWEQRKREMAARGWFASERKRPLPKYPFRVGVITSPTGAVIQDILRILYRRFSATSLLLYPVKVQGEEAAGQIACAISEMNRWQLADVLIVGRGGGSIEDLWAFNEEIVVQALLTSHIPTVSAVGHETDVTLADFVADVRAPTPSAAAELVIGKKVEAICALPKWREHLDSCIREKIENRRAQLSSVRRHPLFFSSSQLLGTFFQQIDEREREIQEYCLNLLRCKKETLLLLAKEWEGKHPEHLLQLSASGLAQMEERWQEKMKEYLCHLPHRFPLKRWRAELDLWLTKKWEECQHKWEEIGNQLHHAHPRTLGKRGYILARREKQVVTRARECSINQPLSLSFIDGTVSARISEILLQREE